MSENNEAVMALAQKIMAKKQEQAKKRVEEIGTKYPHADASTVQFDPTHNKYSVEITCTKCGAKGRRVYTSDLFQVRTCTKCADAVKADKRAEKKAAIKAALEMLRTQK